MGNSVDDAIRDAIAENLASTHFGDRLRAEGHSIVVLEGERLVRIAPDGARTALGVDRQVEAALAQARSGKFSANPTV